MSTLATALGNAIRKRRQAAGLSQEKLAEGSGLHRTYVGLVERGQRNVTVQALDRIGRVVGVRASVLVAEAEAAAPTPGAAADPEG